jgi:O-methyltransferase
VWAADSFEGLPKPELAQDFETGDCSKDTYPNLAVSLEEVRALFERYGLLDAQVQFLKGWFKDTLLAAPIEQLALLRLDGDMYSSTMDALRALYHKVAPGGFVIIDDYHSFAGCKQAVDNFRRKQQISEPMEQIDVAAVYWRKS